MSGIRPLERRDLDDVAALFDQVMGTGTSSRAQIARYFERTLLDDPWADPDIPSLVHETAEGSIIGFIGASTRRLRVDGRPARLAVSSNLVVDPDWRTRGVGALLLRRLMAGPQDLTLADRSNDDSLKMWRELGGQELVHASVGWYRILRPGRAVGALMDLQEREGLVRRVARGVARPIDALAPRVRRLAAEPGEPAGTREPLTIEGLLEQMSSIGRRLRLYPDYDEAFLSWALDEVAAVPRIGRPVARLVRAANGRVLGWFVYVLPEHGVAQVLQLCATGSDPEPVVDHLFRQAFDDGAAVVQGRLEPRLSGVLSRPGVVVRRSARALVASEDSTALALLGSTKSLMSHLDGEWLVSMARRL
ncbi:GNAT family N-acetyltransferase [Actinomycetospora lutea]|uniref:GNAT family N-acetyltransferase n=1 Tax=Actinomycetospora lutea TaxID=663604 RepID=UPI0023665142|nr:GNAT family N-acetyltransferase [Actinomycetospora lutea]MDD7940820.1 GNAT family N-acetyltransferase [Actinomycetospora lutea]